MENTYTCLPSSYNLLLPQSNNRNNTNYKAYWKHSV